MKSRVARRLYPVKLFMNTGGFIIRLYFLCEVRIERIMDIVSCELLFGMTLLFLLDMDSFIKAFRKKVANYIIYFVLHSIE